jgi:hypothetical protein
MLRIFSFDEPLTLKLRLEGELDRSSLPQYETAVSSAMDQRSGRKLLLDIGDLTLADSAAEEAIVQGSRTELHFVAAVNRSAEVLREEERTECKKRCPWWKRIALLLAEQLGSSTCPVWMKLSRSLNNEG